MLFLRFFLQTDRPYRGYNLVVYWVFQKPNNLIWHSGKIMQYRRPACAMHTDRSQAKGATFFFTAKVDKGFGSGISGNIRLGMRLILQSMSNIFISIRLNMDWEKTSVEQSYFGLHRHVAPIGATCL